MAKLSRFLSQVLNSKLGRSPLLQCNAMYNWPTRRSGLLATQLKYFVKQSKRLIKNWIKLMTLFAPLASTTMSSNSTETPAPAPAASTTTSSSTIKKTGGVRLMSLNQLAARVSSNAAPSSNPARPRHRDLVWRRSLCAQAQDRRRVWALPLLQQTPRRSTRPALDLSRPPRATHPCRAMPPRAPIW